MSCGISEFHTSVEHGLNREYKSVWNTQYIYMASIQHGIFQSSESELTRGRVVNHAHEACHLGHFEGGQGTWPDFGQSEGSALLVP